MSADEVEGFFRTSDVLEITEVIRSASDDELRALIDLDHFRAEGVVAILDRFAEFADAGPAPGDHRVVRFELAAVEEGRRAAHRPLRRRHVTLEEDAEFDVTIAADIVDFVRLVTASPTRRCSTSAPARPSRVTRCSPWRSAASSPYRGQRPAAVDPTALDPVDVATAVATTSGEHMRAVMEGGFRPIVLAEVFRRFPTSSMPSKAGDLELSVGFRIGGRRGWRGRPLRRARRHGVCTIETSPPRDSAATRPSPSRGRLPAARDRPASPGARGAHRHAQGQGRPGQGARPERGDRAASAARRATARRRSPACRAGWPRHAARRSTGRG